MRASSSSAPGLHRPSASFSGWSATCYNAHVDNIPLLASCARIEPDIEQLRSLSACVKDWRALISQAERHGVGPLLYSHLKSACIALPPEASVSLAGVYLRHRQANGLRFQVLTEILEAFQASNVRALVVKGGALAQILYPEIALRPMSDLDLLVDADQLTRAAAVLQELGMSAASVDAGQHGKGLATCGKAVAGIWVGVELHTDLFEAGFPASLTMRSLHDQPIAFHLGTTGVEGHTLGPGDLLWHLCQHLRFHTTVFLPWRLIWMADIIGVAEGRLGAMPWEELRRARPETLALLSLVHCLCPLPRAVLDGAGLESRQPSGIGLDFDGWPRKSLAQQKEKGTAAILRDTLVPPEWWLRLHYGLGTDELALWQRWISHPWTIAKAGAGMVASRTLLRARRQAGARAHLSEGRTR